MKHSMSLESILQVSLKMLRSVSLHLAAPGPSRVLLDEAWQARCVVPTSEVRAVIRILGIALVSREVRL